MTQQPDVIIIGAGLAGLAAARTCAQSGLTPLVLEMADDVGGRLTTESVDGFLLDRGFQVLLDSYPEARAVLDLKALQLGRFAPGALVRRGEGFGRVADPWRAPVAGVGSLLSGIFTVGDALRMLRLRSDAMLSLEGEPVAHGEVTAARALHARGFSDRAINRFFRPFFGGVFLDPQLSASQEWFEFLFGMFATGSATLPANGMQAIPRQLAAALPVGTVRTRVQVRALHEGAVELAHGERIAARAIIVATDARHASVLIPSMRPPAWNACATIYYAAPASPISQPLLVLDGEGRRGPVNHVCVPSDIAPGYAPPGQALISATVVGTPPTEDGALDRDARGQMTRWFGDQVQDWRLLRIAHVPYSLPRASPRADARDAAVRVGAGLYACGDYLETPSINGALRSGRRAAEAVVADLVR
jgi:phytoene dehydrogenase-like protein